MTVTFQTGACYVSYLLALLCNPSECLCGDLCKGGGGGGGCRL